MPKRKAQALTLPQSLSPQRSLALSQRGMDFLLKNDGGQDLVVRPEGAGLPAVEQKNVATILD